jgi:phytoene dehydrogenase-like protein
MSKQVLILGGGIAGLTAALFLRERGFHITILEQAAEVGGRLIHAPPPCLLGAHAATWRLCNRLDLETALRRMRHTPIEFLQGDGRHVQFLHFPLPSPLNTLLGTSLFQGLSMRDRWQLLSFLERTWEQDPPLPDDLELRIADEWFASIGQSEAARQGVWSSLSRFLLGAPLKEVSAALFMRTLRRSFFTGVRPAKMIVPPQGAGVWLIAPLKARLDRSGVEFKLSAPVHRIRFDSNRVSGIELADRHIMTADWYVAALPRHELTHLIPERVLTHYGYFQQLGRLTESPYLVVQLHAEQPSTGTRVVLLERRTFHWLIHQSDETMKEGTSNIWAVAVGDDRLIDRQEEVIRAAVEDAQAALSLAAPPPVISSRCHREPRAILDVKPGTQQYRPLQQSPFSNFLVAGDWTDTGWPSLLESAVLSGQRCADAIPG